MTSATILRSGLVTSNWDFEFKLALVAGLVRCSHCPSDVVVNLLSADFLREHVSPMLAARSLELPDALFHVFARASQTCEEFLAFYRALSANWSDKTQRKVLGDMLGKGFETLLWTPACDCGCCEAGLNQDILAKVTGLAKVGLMGLPRLESQFVLGAGCGSISGGGSSGKSCEMLEMENAGSVSRDEGGENFCDIGHGSIAATSVMALGTPGMSRYRIAEE